LGEDIAHPDDLPPWHFGAVLTQIGRDARGGLANDLELVGNPVLDELVVLESFAATDSVAVDALDGFEDVEEPLAIVAPLHRDRFAEHALADAGPQAASRDDVDWAAEQVRQVHDQAAEVQQAAARLQVDEEVSLAASASPRATEPNTRTLWAPCCLASSRISSRRLAISSAGSVGAPMEPRMLAGPPPCLSGFASMVTSGGYAVLPARLTAP
jgi:hypothetical protein